MWHIITWGYYVSRLGWHSMSCAMCCSQKQSPGVTSSASVMAAVRVVVAVVATIMAAAMVTVMNGGNHLGHQGDCTAPGLGSLMRRRGRPSEWTQPSAQEGSMFPLSLSGLQSPQHLPAQRPMPMAAALAYLSGITMTGGHLCVQLLQASKYLPTYCATW